MHALAALDDDAPRVVLEWDPLSPWLQARTMRTWLNYPAAPPPLNILSVPYALFVSGWQLLQYRQQTRQVEIASATRSGQSNLKRQSSQAAWSDELPLQLPESYLQELMADPHESPAHGLHSLIVDFMEEQGDSVIREDRWKTEMMRAVSCRDGGGNKEVAASVRAAADAQAREVAVLRDAQAAEMAALKAVVAIQAHEMAALTAAVESLVHGGSAPVHHTVAARLVRDCSARAQGPITTAASGAGWPDLAQDAPKDARFVVPDTAIRLSPKGDAPSAVDSHL